MTELRDASTTVVGLGLAGMVLLFGCAAMAGSDRLSSSGYPVDGEGTTRRAAAITRVPATLANSLWDTLVEVPVAGQIVRCGFTKTTLIPFVTVVSLGFVAGLTLLLNIVEKEFVKPVTRLGSKKRSEAH